MECPRGLDVAPRLRMTSISLQPTRAGREPSVRGLSRTVRQVRSAAADQLPRDGSRFFEARHPRRVRRSKTSGGDSLFVVSLHPIPRYSRSILTMDGVPDRSEGMTSNSAHLTALAIRGIHGTIDTENGRGG